MGKVEGWCLCISAHAIMLQVQVSYLIEQFERLALLFSSSSPVITQLTSRREMEMRRKVML